MYFNAYALSVPYLTDLGHYIGHNLPLPHEIADWWNQFKNWRPPRRDPLAIDLDGDCNTTINDYNSTDRKNAEHQDKLFFGEGITLSDLSWFRYGTSLLFMIKDTHETITISSYSSAGFYQVEAAELSDGTQ